MNKIFFGILLFSVAFAVVNGTPGAVSAGAMSAAGTSVTIALGLIGMMALFLGLMKIVEEAGGLQFMARLIRPIIVRLFPDVPEDHPAMGAMIMNMAANALGLGNAATPFGVKAMKELNELNKEKGTATNAMVLFLAINTSGLALMPLGAITYRQQAGSLDPASIFSTTLVATACSTIVGLTVAKLFSRLPWFRAPAVQIEADKALAKERAVHTELKDWAMLLGFGLALVSLVVTVYSFSGANDWIMPLLIVGMVGLGIVRGVPVYEVFVEGAKEGFSIAILIIPYLVAILVSISMLRASGGLVAITDVLGSVTLMVGLPPEVLPLAFLRPLSGSGSSGIHLDLLHTYGADSFIGQLASTMSGSTETTFYVLAVYFGAVGVHRTRHAIPAGLAADITGVFASVFAVKLLLNPGTSLMVSEHCNQQEDLVDWAEQVRSPSTPPREPMSYSVPFNGSSNLIDIPVNSEHEYRIQVCVDEPDSEEALPIRTVLTLFDREFGRLVSEDGTEPVLVWRPDAHRSRVNVGFALSQPGASSHWGARVELTVHSRPVAQP